MNLNRLREDLAAFSNLHPLTPTDVSNVYYDPIFGVVLESTTEQTLQSDIKDLKLELEDCNKFLKEEQDKVSQLENENREISQLLDEVKSEEEKGSTLLAYKARAEQAEESAKEWKRGYQMATEEATKLRKRKGITTNFVQYEADILRYMASIVAYPNDKAYTNAISELLKKIRDHA